jgi:predicted nucleic acid-binding Zn ribbon protein
MRRRAPRPLAVALAGVTAGLEPASVLARVQGCWRDAVGDTIGAEAEPVSEREGVVTVACRSSVWANELELLGPELLDKVNAALGSTVVTQLRFAAGDRRGRVATK